MANTLSFAGVYPILATPFDEQENLDLESFQRLIRFMAGIGVDGVTILGGLGEANRLLDWERKQLIRTAVEAAGRLPVIVGISHGGTQAALALGQMAQSLGAQAVMVAPPWEPTPSEERIFEHYLRVAEGLAIPVVVQDHPASTQVHMSVAFLLRLAQASPRIACIKEEALPTPARIAALVRGMGSRRVPVLTGLGALYGLFDLEQGASGFNTGFAFPEVLMAMVKAAGKGDWERARQIYTRFLPLIVFEQQPGVAIRKECLRRRGLIASARVRHPGAGFAPETARQLSALLDALLPGVDLTQPLAI